MITAQEVTAFQKIVWDYFAAHGRHDLPWRLSEANGSFDPYKILVSEIMLQQTQVARVRPKYETFLRTFPTVEDLAAATLGDVLVAWQGLGYNRRAKFLWQAAQKIVQDFGGTIPQSQKELTTLPGVGANTAGAIRAYALNQPAEFVETNIRTVFIHHFFHDQTSISDTEILELVNLTLPREEEKRAARAAEFTSTPGVMRKNVVLSHVRFWYWALMDYGVHLKQTIGNVSRASKSYAKQSKFDGSLRQVRGHVLRLLSRGTCTFEELTTEVTDDRLLVVLQKLEHEGLIRRQSKHYSLF